jgi:hypothetical protein
LGISSSDPRQKRPEDRGAVRREERLGVELHTLDVERAMPKAHHFAFRGPRRANELVAEARRIHE